MGGKLAVIRVLSCGGSIHVFYGHGRAFTKFFLQQSSNNNHSAQINKDTNTSENASNISPSINNIYVNFHMAF